MIAGSSGFIGGLLLQRLVASEQVLAISCLIRRDTMADQSDHTKLRAVVTDFAIAPPNLEITYDAVFLCLGPTRTRAGSAEAFHRIEHDYAVTAARWAAERGTRFCAYVSSVGASVSSSSFYLRTKGETERDLATLGFAALHLYRPSFLTGRPHFNWRERTGAAACRAIYALGLGPKSGDLMPIAGAAVADAMVRALSDGTTGARVHHYTDMMTKAT